MEIRITEKHHTVTRFASHSRKRNRTRTSKISYPPKKKKQAIKVTARTIHVREKQMKAYVDNSEEVAIAKEAPKQNNLFSCIGISPLYRGASKTLTQRNKHSLHATRVEVESRLHYLLNNSIGFGSFNPSDSTSGPGVYHTCAFRLVSFLFIPLL